MYIRRLFHCNRLIALIIFVLVFGSTKLESKNAGIETYTEFGRRSSAEDFIEEDNDDNYSYFRSNLKLSHQSRPSLKLQLSGFYYEKKYTDVLELNNQTRILKTGVGYKLPSFSSLETTLKLGSQFRVKRFDNNPSNEYNQIKFSPGISLKNKNDLTIQLDFGLNSFDYLTQDSRDQVRVYGKIGFKKMYFDKKWMIRSSYKIDSTNRTNTNRKRDKQDVTAGTSYLFDYPLFKKIALSFSWGQRDSKEDEIRDEDFDFEMIQYRVSTEHPFSSLVNMKLSFRTFKKDYLSSTLDSQGFLIENDWEILLNKGSPRKLKFEFGGQYKDMEYPLRIDREFSKGSIHSGISTGRRNHWKGSVEFRADFYDFVSQTIDRNRYFFLASIDQPLLERQLWIGVKLKYKMTHFEEKEDTEQESIRIELKYKF